VRRGRASGFECSIVPFSELKETYPETDFAGSWPCVYAFWFGTIAESIGALMAITACVTSVGGARLLSRGRSLADRRSGRPVRARDGARG
jgi:hypothetical protein